MKELWIGVVEVLTEPSTGDGDTRAFTNVIACAESAADFVKRVKNAFDEYGWTILGNENVRPVNSDDAYPEEILEIIDRARMNPNACIFATMHYYPSKPN